MSEYTGPLTATQAEPTIWFDDLEVDQTFDLGSVVAEHDDVIEFAKRFDPQWYHVDEAAAQSSHWGQITASGWWTASSMMRLYVDGFLSKIAPDASPGMENVRWHKAVYVGDELRAQMTIVDKKDSSRGPHLGTLTIKWEVLRGDDVVMSMVGRGWFHKRPAAS